MSAKRRRYYVVYSATDASGGLIGRNTVSLDLPLTTMAQIKAMEEALRLEGNYTNLFLTWWTELIE